MQVLRHHGMMQLSVCAQTSRARSFSGHLRRTAGPRAVVRTLGGLKGDAPPESALKQSDESHE